MCLCRNGARILKSWFLRSVSQRDTVHRDHTNNQVLQTFNPFPPWMERVNGTPTIKYCKPLTLSLPGWKGLMGPNNQVLQTLNPFPPWMERVNGTPTIKYCKPRLWREVSANGTTYPHRPRFVSLFGLYHPQSCGPTI